MITGCSCIRPASKTNRSHIYQQFKAAGRDCRCPFGFLRVPTDSYCDRVPYLDSPSIGGSKDQSRKLHATPQYWCANCERVVVEIEIIPMPQMLYIRKNSRIRGTKSQDHANLFAQNRNNFSCAEIESN